MPPVEIISTEALLSLRAKSTRPVLSETLMSARVIFFKLLLFQGINRPNDPIGAVYISIFRSSVNSQSPTG